MSSGLTALAMRPVSAGPATPNPIPVRAKPRMISQSDEPTPTALRTNMETMVAEAPKDEAGAGGGMPGGGMGGMGGMDF